MYYRFSNTVIGYLNLLTLVASIPIIGGALWLTKTTSTCQTFLQTPLLILGFVIFLISLLGFVGACFNVVWALWLYLVTMLFLIGALLGLTAFGFAVTSQGGGIPVSGRVYKEYKLDGYSGWMRNKVMDAKNWEAIRGCLLGSKACQKISTWTPLDYMERDLTPIQSGCCKPPTSCNYGVTSTVMAVQDADCYRWNNLPTVLCYGCNSCKAAVLEDSRQEWHKLSVLNIVVLVFLIGVYSIGCCAFRNARRSDSDHPYGENRMSKVRPRWDFYWWRRWYDRRDQLY